MQKFVTCLWFDGKAEEAADFYASIFKNSKVGKITRYGDSGPGEKGTVMTVAFQLNGQKFLALNGGPQFTFSEAVSFVVACGTQKELDELWGKLSWEGKTQLCGWLKDRYGVSWQIVPSVLERMLEDSDAGRSGKVMEALLKMGKIDIRTLKQAYKAEKVTAQ